MAGRARGFQLASPLCSDIPSPADPGPRPYGYTHGKLRDYGFTPWKNNLTMNQASTIMAQLLATGDRKYRISSMYIEYVNVPSPGDHAAVPTYDATDAEAVTYYNALGDSTDTDYLRVPIIAGIVSSDDETLYPLGNMVTWFAQTAGVTGVHGKPFGSEHNSLVIGGALVAMLDEADHTQDLVYCRFYFDTADQLPKLASGQVGIEWVTPLTTA